MSFIIKDIEDLEDKCIEWGASLTGVSVVRNCLDEKYKPLDYCLTVAVRLSDFVIDQITDKPTFTYFHHYRTANFLLDQIAMRATLYFMEKGFLALAVPASQTVNDVEDAHSGIFQHKTAARLAGLGFIGKSGLFVSHEFGPRVRLVSVLTDMPLVSCESGSCEEILMESESYCAACSKCVVACPAGAISGKTWHEGMERNELIRASLCSEYMNKNFKNIGRGSVCGICMKVCPCNGR